MSNVLSLLLAVLVVAGIAAFWVVRALRDAEQRRLALASELEASAAECKELLRRVEHESQARKKQGEELAELRRRADKAKRRAEKGPEAPLGTAARIRDIEQELARAQAALRSAELERDRESRTASALALERAELAKRLEDASAPARAIAEAGQVELERMRAELSTVREENAKQGEALALARQTEARLRKRMDNQEQLYASLRAELDVKKDRIRTQEEQLERLQALKVAVLD